MTSIFVTLESTLSSPLVRVFAKNYLKAYRRSGLVSLKMLKKVKFCAKDSWSKVTYVIVGISFGKLSRPAL